LVDPILAGLLEKLADGAARIRDSSEQSIVSMAGCPSVGCSHVANHVLRALPAKQKTAWRPILGRIEILTKFIKTSGVGGSTGLDTQTILNFLKTNGAFAHSNGEVRDAAKILCVSLHRHVGDDQLIPFLKDALRKKQLEEYQAAFQSSDDEPGGQSPAPAEAKISPRETEQKKSNEPKNNRQSVQTTAEKAAQKDDAKTATADGNDFTVCMFCGKKDKSWNEDGLDLHYWKECPLLSPCHACAQIVEIAGLPEHLLDECEHKDEFEACETTGPMNTLQFEMH
jgi:centrosomal protein CEP104